MAKKAPLPIRAMPLQRGAAREVTNPTDVVVEDAAAKQRLAARRVAARVLALSHRLSAKKRAALLASLASQLPPTVQMDFLEDMLRHLPAEVLRRQEEEFRPRRTDKSTKEDQGGVRRA